MDKIVNGVTKVLGWVLMTLMAMIVLDVTWQVFTRFVIHNSSSWTEEMARFLLIWIGLLGATYTLHTKMHLGIDIFTYKLTGRKKQIIEVIVYVFVALFALIVMVVGGFKLMAMTFELKQISASMGIKMAYIYFVIPLSGILMIFYSVDFIVKALTMKED